ncbi:hypothetical protein C8J56DRAFT_897134 [Mycena floridula]|nr:hypothetical protein C8J56DRAFT_897134 [Mycena floridula]
MKFLQTAGLLNMGLFAMLLGKTWDFDVAQEKFAPWVLLTIVLRIILMNMVGYPSNKIRLSAGRSLYSEFVKAGGYYSVTRDHSISGHRIRHFIGIALWDHRSSNHTRDHISGKQRATWRYREETCSTIRGNVFMSRADEQRNSSSSLDSSDERTEVDIRARDPASSFTRFPENKFEDLRCKSVDRR